MRNPLWNPRKTQITSEPSFRHVFRYEHTSIFYSSIGRCAFFLNADVKLRQKPAYHWRNSGVMPAHDCGAPTDRRVKNSNISPQLIHMIYRNLYNNHILGIVVSCLAEKFFKT